MKRYIQLLIFLAIACTAIARQAIVVDAVTGEPLPGASVFSSGGAVVGICADDGRLPYVSAEAYPIAIRCMGYDGVSGITLADTLVSLRPMSRQLAEMIVKPQRRPMLHMLAFVRDYSTMTRGSDSVALFREKWVDFLIPTDDTKKLTGWQTPRILSTKSYYHFTNADGLDSVSDRFHQNFSWSDWVGVLNNVEIPAKLLGAPVAADTLYGRHSPREIWKKRDECITLHVNVLADTLSQKWAPSFSNFFRNRFDFVKFNIDYAFDDSYSRNIHAVDLSRISCSIESQGRGFNMVGLRDADYDVTTYAEIYIVDKQYVSISEARKISNFKHHHLADFPIPSTDLVPDISPEVATIVDRVNSIDHTATRLATELDDRFNGHVRRVPLTRTQRTLRAVLGLFGINYQPEPKPLPGLE